MEVIDFFVKLRTEWPRMSAAGLIGAGLLVGWTAAWIIFRQQLAHRADVIEHLKDALAERLPPQLALKLSGAAHSRRGAGMGLALVVIGLVIAAFGAFLIYRGTDDAVSHSKVTSAIADVPAPKEAPPVPASSVKQLDLELKSNTIDRIFVDVTAQYLCNLYKDKD